MYFTPIPNTKPMHKIDICWQRTIEMNQINPWMGIKTQRNKIQARVALLREWVYYVNAESWMKATDKISGGGQRENEHD